MNSHQVGYNQQSPIYGASNHLASSGAKGQFVSPIYKQEGVASHGPVNVSHCYSPNYASGVSPQYGHPTLGPGSIQGGANPVSPSYSPSAGGAVQSPSYSNVQGAGSNNSSGEKPKFSAYSPAYSPSAFSPGSVPHGPNSSVHSSSNKTVNSGTIPISSPLYVPPSIGESSMKHGKTDAVVSPKYAPQQSTVVVHSPTYNPASPKYAGPKGSGTIKEESDESD